jgi:hypothetical protein
MDGKRAGLLVVGDLEDGVHLGEVIFDGDSVGFVAPLFGCFDGNREGR